MTTIPKRWTFAKLPAAARRSILAQHTAANLEAYHSGKALKGGLFGDMDSTPLTTTAGNVLWATDSYLELGDDHGFSHPLHDLSIIKPRVEKTKEEQQKRVKSKAEVFTPPWLVNFQNNLVDERFVDNPFNTADISDKSWEPSTGEVTFKEGSWTDYLTSRRLEMCCGEAPYLCSPYDPTTGDYIPLRDSQGRYQRVGLLDRKLRVVNEHADNLEQWEQLAMAAVATTYGFEWQGDNLVIARLNIINTVFDYRQDFIEGLGSGAGEAGAGVGDTVITDDKAELRRLVNQVAELVSWQIWQMDGLKMVIPGSCSEGCRSCKRRNRTGHDGVHPVIKWGDELILFEDLME